jgi:transcriptional regulator with XRE-family HTH domain
LTNHNAALGKALRRLREERNLTIETLAYQAGLDRNGISLIEVGRRSPTFNTIAALLRTMNVGIVELARLIEEELNQSE